MSGVATPRVLIVRPDHLGDLLLSLPAVAWLREVAPHARIVALVPPALAPIAQRCPAIDETLTAPFPAPESADAPAGWAAALAALAAPLRGRFDIALVPRIDDPWSGALAMATEIPCRIGFDHPRTARYLTTALATPRNLHVTRLALRVAGAAARQLQLSDDHAEPVPGQPWIIPTAADHREASTVISACGISNERQLIALHPGAGWPLKAWPVERWGLLARYIQRMYGVRPLVTGGIAEQVMVAAVVTESRGAAVSVAGSLSLGGLAALYQRASAVVAIDSGPLHLAVAVGTRVVGIYGPAGADEFGPWAPPKRQRVVQSGLSCSPCRTLLAPPCGAVTQPACLRAVTVDAVVTALGALLGPGQSSPAAWEMMMSSSGG